MKLAELLPSVTVPPPVSVTAELPIISDVASPAELRVMPPPLVMVVPPMVSEVPSLKFRTLVLPSVRLLIEPFTFSCTTEEEVVIEASLPEPGTAPNDQDAAVLQ